MTGSDITVDEYNAAGTGVYSTQTGTPAKLGFQKFVNFGAHVGGTSGSGSSSSSGSASDPSSNSSGAGLSGSTSSGSTSSGSTSAPAPTFAETSGGVVHTWSNYSNAGGTEGPEIPPNDTVQILCAVTGFTVADGNTWWYQVASSPWNGTYYASADAFYNNSATSGSLTRRFQTART